MSKRPRSNKYPAGTPPKARLAVRHYYEALQLDWTLELQTEPTNWDRLFTLHYDLADLERRAPWLKQEAR